MNLRDLGIVYRKELRDLLRDRRTIISMFVVPLVMMPLVSASVGIVALHQMREVMQETYPIMVLGGEDSPKTLTALRQLDNLEFVAAAPDYKQQIADKKIRAAVEIPPGFDAALDNGAPATIRIYDYEGEFKSETATRTLRDFFSDWRDQTVAARLAQRNLPKDLTHPFEVETDNVAPPEKVSGNLLGALLPYIVLITCLAGAIYPAIDLTAGEKERGTMETLLSSPVQRMDLALGKCLTVMTVSMTTVGLSLASSGVTLLLVKHFGANLMRQSGLPLAVSPLALLAVFALMLPTALFFSSALLSIGLFARNTKEANSYLQPMMIVVIFPAMMSLLPGFELNYVRALIPVVNASLLCKEVLSGAYHWNYIALVFGSSCAYAAVALTAAVALFKRESVIFRA